MFIDAARNATTMLTGNTTTTYAGLWNILLPAVLLKTSGELGIWTCLLDPSYQASISVFIARTFFKPAQFVSVL
jgi:hypothetical protein